MKRSRTAQEGIGVLEEDAPVRLGSGSPRVRRERSDTIAFRLGGDVLAALAERALYHDMSVHLYARALVIGALLEGETLNALQAEINGARQESRQLRIDLVFCMKTLLMTAGKLSEEDVNDWVNRNFKL